MISEAKIDDIDGNISFPLEEDKILKYWDEIDAFNTSLEINKDLPEYSFYDGPPFATGLPHYGHILAGTIKDTVTRYYHQTGRNCYRRFGWDCHGLPVEYEIDQKLGIKSKDDVLAMGIAEYNKHCRSIVLRYTAEWKKTVTRLGRWIDFDNDYKTMDPKFMESVWWVFETLHKKGLVYKGFKVMPFSTACATPLSNFEAGLNYKDVRDPSIVVSFSLKDNGEKWDGCSILAWTSTPWTLPSNLALCVHPELTYALIRDIKTGNRWILCEQRLVQIYPIIGTKKWDPKKSGETYEILGTFQGKDLVGMKYEPLFPYFSERAGKSFKVVADSYVSSDDGTGIVHQAPAFGEDDYRVCIGNGVVTKGEEIPCPVDFNGRFTSEVTDFQGRYVKEADNDICAALKAKGRMVIKDQYTHSYPFCWRSDTPLIYRAVPSWFVAVEKLKERLIENNKKTHWVPTAVQEKRFHNWLLDAKDWAISRNRFWGTPIPLWMSDDGEEIVVIGSIQQLEQLSGQRITDLHKESIDHITIPSKLGKGELKRVEEVFDCWFESGSMPYAQQHYPFENKQKFEKNFPADFVAEGLDQTRGWFYTLSVLSTALFDAPPFKHLICNGLVLAENGKKMSKRLQNYPDPNIIVDKYGADSLRLYLIDSPVVRAESLRFRKAGVEAVVKDVFLPWFNTLRFFVQQARRWEMTDNEGKPFLPDRELTFSSENVMDTWVIASLQGLVKFFHEEMEAYRLYTVVPKLVNFIRDLTNWYVRLNRLRLKGSDGHEEARVGLTCLYEVLLVMSQLMAPFSPFFSEYVYQSLRKIHPNYKKRNESGSELGKSSELGAAQSVHYLKLPRHNPDLINKQSEADMKNMQMVIELVRLGRDRRNISLKMPLKQLLVISTNENVLNSVRKLEAYIKSEVNILDIEVSREEKKWCTVSAEPNNKLIGQRFGKEAKEIKAALKGLSEEQLLTLLKDQAISLKGHELNTEEILVVRSFKGDSSVYEACASSEGDVIVALDIRKDRNILQQRIAREILNRIQKLRKKAGLNMSDNVEAFFSESGENGIITEAIKANASMIKEATRAVPLPTEFQPIHAPVIVSETFSIEESDGKESVTCSLALTRPALSVNPALNKADSVMFGFLGSLDYSVARQEDWQLQLDERKYLAVKDKDYFASAVEMVVALKPKGYEWVR